MIKQKHLLRVLFILVVISICKGQHASTCNVFPKDQYIEVGSKTEVVCWTSCVRGKVFWTLNNRHISDNLSNTINSSHTVLTLKAFTHHNATVQCHSVDTHQILGGTTIRTYSKPSNIACIWYYKNKNDNGTPNRFSCTWEHQMASSLKINYTVIYKFREEETEICTSHETTCTSDTSIILSFGYTSVTVRAKTAAWEVYSDPLIFNPRHIIKINPPRLEQVTAFSDHLLVNWISQVQRTKCHCQVKYGKVVNDGTPEKIINKSLDPCQRFNESIEQVESCTNYTIVVRCSLDNASWSDWSEEKTVFTKLNRRDVNLRLWRKVAEPEKNEIRKVHTMWTEIPPTCQDIFTSTIKLTPYKDQTTGVNYTDILCGTSTCELDVNQDAHTINLRVFQNETLLGNDSVYVPATGESLPHVTDIETSSSEGVILVSWRAPVQPVSGYIIDWTHNGKQYYWKESKYTNAKLFGLLDKKPYDITVTPLFDDKTGRGTQALHICSTTGDPGNITITSVKADHTSAFVSWDTKSQEECSSAVISYTVFYGTQTGVILNVTVNSTKLDITLKDLNPDTQYRVYIKATAHNGTSKSSERIIKTKRFDPDLIIILWVVGSIIIVLVLSLGLFCAAQWKKFSEKPVPNPGLSSLALWSSPSHQKKSLIQPFSNPSDGRFDQVYTEETQRTSTSPLTSGWNMNPASEQTGEYTDPTIAFAPDGLNGKQAETQHPCSPGESTTLLCSENNLLNPYRSQGSVETPNMANNKLCKRVQVKQLGKTAPMTVYVTLDMFQQGQSR